MRRADAIVLSTCTAIVACCLVYAWNPPGPRFYPLENVWRMESIPGEPSMGWYARVLWGAAAAAGGGLLPYAALRWRGSEHAAGNGLVWSLSALAFASLVGACIYIVVHELSRAH